MNLLISPSEDLNNTTTDGFMKADMPLNKETETDFHMLIIVTG